MSGWPAAIARIDLDSVDSTNQYAISRARDFDLPTWITATTQTEGYGRHRRDWLSAPGNLHASYIRPQRTGMPPAPLYSFVAALAVHDCLYRLAGNCCRLELKWPNDVLADGGKVAGILLEGVAAPTQASLVIGIGINLVHAPDIPTPDSRFRPVDLASMTGMTYATDAVLTILAETMMQREEQINMDGFATIRDDWLKRAAGLGQEVMARCEQGTLTGTLQTIDASGFAVLDCFGVQKKLVAADLVFAPS